jgi:hypothetical protein
VRRYHGWHFATLADQMTLGITRKQLNINFIGHEHDALRMILVDMYINGLSNDASRISH